MGRCLPGRVLRSPDLDDEGLALISCLPLPRGGGIGMSYLLCYSMGMRSTLVALVLAVASSGMTVPAPVSTGDVLTGHSRHDGYDPMRTRQGGSADVLTLVPDSAMTCWIEDNGYGAEKLCGAKAGLAELA